MDALNAFCDRESVFIIFSSFSFSSLIVLERKNSLLQRFDVNVVLELVLG